MTTVPAIQYRVCPPAPVNKTVDVDGLESLQLIQLEWSFRQWAKVTSDDETQPARQKILIVFLLLRYCGAPLEEVLALNLDRDLRSHSILINDVEAPRQGAREVALAEYIAQDIRQLLHQPHIHPGLVSAVVLTPPAVEQAFAERGAACGLPVALCSPEKISRARSMELQRLGSTQAKIKPSPQSVAPAAQISMTANNVDRNRKGMTRGQIQIFRHSPSTACI